MYQYRLIDDSGLFVEDVISDAEISDPHYIETPCPGGFYHPKWDGEKWIEGGNPPEHTPEQLERLYHQRVVELIRQRYSENDELAILRKKLAGTDEMEFTEYNQYAEQCKQIARNEILKGE